MKGCFKNRLSIGAGALAALALSGNGHGRDKTAGGFTRGSDGRREVAWSAAISAKLGAFSRVQSCVGEKMVGDRPDGQQIFQWMVDCAGTLPEDETHIAWNAESGFIEMVSRMAPSAAMRPRYSLSRSQAIRLAAQWVRELPVAPQGERWRLKGAHQTGIAWHFVCETSSRRARVLIHSRSGDLLLLNVHPKRFHTAS